jgi:transposase
MTTSLIFTPDDGQLGLSPWRLASILTMQFYENLADYQAAEAVWARIDWKYLLGWELTPQNTWASS